MVVMKGSVIFLKKNGPGVPGPQCRPEPAWPGPGLGLGPGSLAWDRAHAGSPAWGRAQGPRPGAGPRVPGLGPGPGSPAWGRAQGPRLGTGPSVPGLPRHDGLYLDMLT